MKPRNKQETSHKQDKVDEYQHLASSAFLSSTLLAPAMLQSKGSGSWDSPSKTVSYSLL